VTPFSTYDRGLDLTWVTTCWWSRRSSQMADVGMASISAASAPGCNLPSSRTGAPSPSFPAPFFYSSPLFPLVFIPPFPRKIQLRVLGTWDHAASGAATNAFWALKTYIMATF